MLTWVPFIYTSYFINLGKARKLYERCAQALFRRFDAGLESAHSWLNISDRLDLAELWLYVNDTVHAKASTPCELIDNNKITGLIIVSNPLRQLR